MQVEKNSVFQKQHPLTNLVYLLGMLLVPALTMHPMLIGLSFIIALSYSIWLKGVSVVKVTLFCGLPILFFSVIVLPLFHHNGVTSLFYMNGQAITLEAVWYGICMTGTLVSVLLFFQIWNVMIDSEKLLYLFQFLFPAVGLLLSMVFRMLPMLRRRYKEIMDAQKGLGRIEGQMSLLNRVMMMEKSFSTLISWSLEHSMETAISMEARGYGSGKRSSFQLFRLKKGDWKWILFFLIGFTGIGVGIGKGIFSYSYYPAIEGTDIRQYILWYSVYFILGMAPMVVDWMHFRRSNERNAE